MARASKKTPTLEFKGMTIPVVSVTPAMVTPLEVMVGSVTVAAEVSCPAVLKVTGVL